MATEAKSETKVEKKMTADERIEAIIELLAANGISIPEALAK